MSLFVRDRHHIARRVSAMIVAGAAVAAVGVIAAAPSSAAPPAGATRAGTATARVNDRVVDIPVSFTVRNVNRSDVKCASDGKTYTERGDLIAPSRVLREGIGSRQITLYLHGLSFGEFFWNFKAVSGYDYAQHQARSGQASLVLDRLGYGRSDKPVGSAICVGARADIAHQEIQALRSGKYTVGASVKTAPRFGRVLLAGHSYGGQIAQVEAYSFGDINELIVISYSDVVQSKLLKANAAYAGKVCAGGGMPVEPGGPSGYASFGPPPGAPAALFHRVAPGVLKAVEPELTLDPCGDTASFAAATTADLTDVAEIHVPVLIIGGGSDALFPPPALSKQGALYTASANVTIRTIGSTGHAVALETTRYMFEHAILHWLPGHCSYRC